MKIESYEMSDNEVLMALRMFNDEDWDDGEFHLVCVESIWEEGCELSEFIQKNSNSEISHDELRKAEMWVREFDNKWLVYVLYKKGEVCGLIAFSDWN